MIRDADLGLSRLVAAVLGHSVGAKDPPSNAVSGAAEGEDASRAGRRETGASAGLSGVMSPLIHEVGTREGSEGATRAGLGSRKREREQGELPDGAGSHKVLCIPGGGSALSAAAAAAPASVASGDAVGGSMPTDGNPATAVAETSEKGTAAPDTNALSGGTTPAVEKSDAQKEEDTRALEVSLLQSRFDMLMHRICNEVVSWPGSDIKYAGAFVRIFFLCQGLDFYTCRATHHLASVCFTMRVATVAVMGTDQWR
jgi:hypothetical protein